MVPGLILLPLVVSPSSQEHAQVAKDRLVNPVVAMATGEVVKLSVVSVW